jgi:hypothetical protein
MDGRRIKAFPQVETKVAERRQGKSEAKADERGWEGIVLLKGRKWKLMKRFVVISMSVVIGVLAHGCTGTNYSYSPRDGMVVARSHNHFLWVGPCGSPWNFDDRINILLPTNTDGGDFSQLKVYQNGRLKIDSGRVVLDRTNQVVTIELTLEGYTEGIEHGPVSCKYNGTHHYVERDPPPDDCSRQWLEDFFRTNGTEMYVR